MNNDTSTMADHAKQATKNAIDDPKETMKESGEEWIEYIRTHPIQSIAFAATVILAIKGLMK